MAYWFCHPADCLKSQFILWKMEPEAFHASSCSGAIWWSSEGCLHWAGHRTDGFHLTPLCHLFRHRWRFAYKCVLNEMVRRRRRNWSWVHMRNYREMCRKYAKVGGPHQFRSALSPCLLIFQSSSFSIYRWCIHCSSCPLHDSIVFLLFPFIRHHSWMPMSEWMNEWINEWINDW